MITITDRLNLSTDYPNVDSRYTDASGNPYATLAAAEDSLAGKDLQYLVGLKKLVMTSGGQAVEYWVQPTGANTYGLVPVPSGGVSAPEVVSVSGAAATIASLQGNKIYRCTEAVTSLTITAFDNATADMEAVIELTTAAAFTSVTFPTGSKFAPLEPVLQPSTSYVLSCQGKIWCASMVSQSANA